MNTHPSETVCSASDSPQAAASVVALALVSNGEVKPSEMAVFAALRAHEQPGLTRQEWHDAVRASCIGLLGPGGHGASARSDARILADMDDVALQRLVLQLCAAVVNADGQID